MDIRKDAAGIKEKQTSTVELFTSVSEKQNKAISNVKAACDILDTQIKEQDKKFNGMNSEVSKQMSVTSVKINSQLKQLDNKLTTETKNIHDEFKTVNHDIRSINDKMAIVDTKLVELTKKNDELSGQMESLTAVSGELEQTTQDLDSRCLHNKESLQGRVERV